MVKVNRNNKSSIYRESGMQFWVKSMWDVEIILLRAKMYICPKNLLWESGNKWKKLEHIYKKEIFGNEFYAWSSLLRLTGFI